MKKIAFLLVWLMLGVTASYSYERVIGDENVMILLVNFIIPPFSLVATGLTFIVYDKDMSSFRIFKK